MGVWDLHVHQHWRHPVQAVRGTGIDVPGAPSNITPISIPHLYSNPDPDLNRDSDPNPGLRLEPDSWSAMHDSRHAECFPLPDGAPERVQVEHAFKATLSNPLTFLTLLLPLLLLRERGTESKARSGGQKES